MGATRLQVQGFLAPLKKIESVKIFLSRQRKTKEFLDRIEYGHEDVLRELMKLMVEDYSYGPNPSDWDGDAGMVWHFGREVPEYDGPGELIAWHRVYIKLCLMRDEEGNLMTCMSFHPPEKSMVFPHTKPTKRWSVTRTPTAIRLARYAAAIIRST